MAADPTALHVPVSWSRAKLPSIAPMAGWGEEGDVSVLTLPNLGEVELSDRGVLLRAPDEAARDALWSRVSDWAMAQVLQARGFAVARGAAIGCGERVVMLTGAPRCGASITAMVATLRGWALISDGLVVLGAEGEVLPRSTEITLDAHATRGMPEGVPMRALPTGSPRVALTVPTHPGGLLTDVVLMSLAQGISTLVLTRLSPDDLPEGSFDGASYECTLRAHPQPLRDVVRAAGARITSLARPRLVGDRHGPQCLPPGLTDRLLAALLSEVSSL